MSQWYADRFSPGLRPYGSMDGVCVHGGWRGHRLKRSVDKALGLISWTNKDGNIGAFIILHTRSNVGIAIISHPFLIVYTTHLW